MNVSIREVISDAGRYAVRNPSTMLRLLTHAANLRLAIPLDAVRWLAGRLLGGGDVSNVEITPQAPGLRLQGDSVFMGNPMRAAATITVRSVTVAPGTLTTTIKVSNLTMEALTEPSPLSQLLASGVLNLSKPGSLLKFMGKKPEVIVDATDDEFVLDLMKVPDVSGNPRIQQALKAFTPVFHLKEVFTEEDFLLVAFRATPSGFPQMLAAVRELILPS